MSDDLKEKQHLFTHIKQPFMELSGAMLLVSSKYLFMSEKMFTTLSTISQSHISAQQLIGCGFLALLVDVVIGEYCNDGRQLSRGDALNLTRCIYSLRRILWQP